MSQLGIDFGRGNGHCKDDNEVRQVKTYVFMIPQPTLDAPFNYPMRKKKNSKTSQTHR